MLTQHQVAGAGGLALGAVDGGRVGQLDVLACVTGREGAQLGGASAPEGEAAVGADVGDGPGVAVAHAEVAVVAPGRDPVPDPEQFPGVGGDRAAVIDVPGGHQPVADESVQHCCLLAGVGHHQHPARALFAGDEGVGGEPGQRLGAFGVAGIDPDLATAPQRVPDLTNPLTMPLTNLLTNRPTNPLTRVLAGRGVGGGAGAQREADGGVLGVGEPMRDVEVDMRLGWDPPRGEVQDPATADGGELVPIPDQRDPRTHLVRHGEEGAGGVLVEHPGLVDLCRRLIRGCVITVRNGVHENFSGSACRSRTSYLRFVRCGAWQP